MSQEATESTEKDRKVRTLTIFDWILIAMISWTVLDTATVLFR